MTLHIDYRPTTFDQIVGNQATVASLKSIYENRESDLPRAVLLQGPKGSGKTTVARIIADILLGKPHDKCPSDFTPIDGGDVKAETVRDIKKLSYIRPMYGNARVWLIEEAHMCGAGGASEKNIPQNNMLTLLEEPPARSYFILCTTDPQRLIGTIRSRCHTFEMQYLRREEMLVLLNRTIKTEEEKTACSLGVSSSTINKIAEASDGCPRDALKLLDQIIDMEPDKMESAISAFFYDEKSTADLCKALLNKESWDRIRLMLKQMDLSNPESIRRAIVGWMAAEVMKGDSPLAALIYDNFQRPFYDNGKAGFIMAVYKTLIDIS